MSTKLLIYILLGLLQVSSCQSDPRRRMTVRVEKSVNLPIRVDPGDDSPNPNVHAVYPWKATDGLEFIVSIFWLSRKIMLCVIGIPMIFVGYRYIIVIMCLLGFCEGISNVWNILFAFYSTTEKQAQQGMSHLAIILSGIIIGLVIGALALLFRKFSYLQLGVISGLSMAGFLIEMLGVINGKPAYMEFSYPLIIFMVFVLSIYSMSGAKDTQILCMAFTGTFYLQNCVRSILKKYINRGNIWLEILYFTLVIGMTIFARWFQKTFTPQKIESELTEAMNPAGTWDLIKRNLGAKKTPPVTEEEFVKASGSNSEKHTDEEMKNIGLEVEVEVEAEDENRESKL